MFKIKYLYRQINERQMIDYLLNREEAHNTLFREALQKVQDSGSNRDWGVDEDARDKKSLLSMDKCLYR